MHSLLKTPETAVFLLLIFLSSATMVLGIEQRNFLQPQGASTLLLITLAFLKISLILSYFMEVRHASTALKTSSRIWVFACYFLVSASSAGVFN